MSFIGETCRPFKQRYSEHSTCRSITAKNKSSALAEHTLQHQDVNMTIADFDLRAVNIIQQCKDSLQTRLSEANAIDRLGPALNRRHEKA